MGSFICDLICFFGGCRFAAAPFVAVSGQAGRFFASIAGSKYHLHRKTHILPSSLHRRQAKVPDSCLHEKKALWRPPDIERETRDAGGLPPMRSLGRICNVFLTKMDALLPATFSMNSLSDLLLLVNAEHKMLYCLKRILKTARPNFFPHAQIIEKRVILWYNYSIYPSDTYLIPHVVSESGIYE